MNIYNEIDYEELRGPTASSTITLDVQDGQDAMKGEEEGNRMRGIMPGKSDEVDLFARSSLSF